ncbi:hypothetical protein BT96DRAFT_1089772 [Gymnopus androsaceus JB14]|uniref:Uncharacterized protein n=1 Tax=Gymnopus androsaceus JB14 TaxID=1447944 RepID=A0A6A4GJE5_9AGAR|nr:hypothetical protein BT96DRAFT_1089772 [Gymnopus androsaceus JB14]
MDHFVRPVVEQFVKAWRPGLRVSRTAASESGAVVEAGILLSVNDLPAVRKVAGFPGVFIRLHLHCLPIAWKNWHIQYGPCSVDPQK